MPLFRSETGSLRRPDAGEAAAIILAFELHADELLMDDREGVLAARRKGFRVAGTPLSAGNRGSVPQ
jgi:predicted nucleic acid-binding protein